MLRRATVIDQIEAAPEPLGRRRTKILHMLVPFHICEFEALHRRPANCGEIGLTKSVQLEDILRPRLDAERPEFRISRGGPKCIFRRHCD